MARTEQKGLDYFPHDTDMWTDYKMKFIRAKYGLDGYAIYNRLLELIYQGKGYYLKFEERDLLMFSDECKREINVINNIINDCINENLFSREIFDSYKILTSSRIQINYVKGSERKKHIYFDQALILIDPLKIKSPKSKAEIIIVSNIKINVNNNPEIVNPKKQIVEETIEETIEESEIIDKSNTHTSLKITEPIEKIDFLEFWNSYDKKVGDKIKLQKKWNNLSLEDQKKAIAHITLYKIAQPDKQYRKNPETYLNNKSWNDEIIKNNWNRQNETLELKVMP